MQRRLVTDIRRVRGHLTSNTRDSKFSRGKQQENFPLMRASPERTAMI